MDSNFVYKMEQVLETYEKKVDPLNPVICFDERPCQLIGDVLAPVPPTSKSVLKVDYEYERNGTACVLLAVEPLTGKRIVQVCKRRTKKEYSKFMENLSRKYPNASKITLVQDNLNTHNPSSFYENMSPEAALALTNRFNFIYTPKKASWLNMAEIELSALSKQCLDRRIGILSKLKSEVKVWVKKRNKNKTKINWQFTNSKARKKFERKYNEIKN
jgi:hypothetical protein